jgi:hypothetical protein
MLRPACPHPNLRPAQVSHTINNAQMASVPGHALWTHFQKAIQARVAAGKRWALDATGPHVLTAVVRVSTTNGWKEVSEWGSLSGHLCM